jgi:hypothetical protein
MQLNQLLSEDRTARHYAFAWEYGTLLEDKPGILNVTWFSDEAHSHLGSNNNKQDD